jgi:hypothetical protein
VLVKCQRKLIGKGTVFYFSLESNVPKIEINYTQRKTSKNVPYFIFLRKPNVPKIKINNSQKKKKKKNHRKRYHTFILREQYQKSIKSQNLYLKMGNPTYDFDILLRVSFFSNFAPFFTNRIPILARLITKKE